MKKKIPKNAKKYLSEGLTMIATAFGLVAALAWNEAVKSLISELVPRGAGVISLFIYAAVVTVLAVFMTTRILRLRDQFNAEEEN